MDRHVDDAEPPIRQVSPEFIAVLEFGERFPQKEREPLLNLGPLWREIARRQDG